MDELLKEYISSEEIKLSEDSTENNKNQEYDDYVKRTKEYYCKMTRTDFLRALWFTLSSCYIGISEYFKYCIGWKSRNNAIIDVSKRLAVKNMMYVKIFQAFATNRNIVSHELNNFFSQFTDNVEYTEEEYDINELKELENRSCECWPYQQLRIENDYTPIKSGLMSLIFKGRIGDDAPIVIKYLRKNISNNFNASMNNLVIFAKLTKYLPYLRTLNIENLILQNVVSLNDQVCFRKELMNIQIYYNGWKDYEYVKIPRPYSDYTEKINGDILVMEYIDGIKIDQIQTDDYDEFGKVLATFNAKAAFCTSVYHGDLHPGNILFIKSPSSPTHQIGILDFGIIGHLSRNDQEILLNTTRYMYQRKYHKLIDLIMSCELTEPIDSETGSTIMSTILQKNNDTYKMMYDEIKQVLVSYTTPTLKFFGVYELYDINYILNKYGLIFKRSLYRLFISIAIMDSIVTRLVNEVSYVEHMTDIVVEMFHIDLNEPDTETETDADTETDTETETETETDADTDTETETETDADTDTETETETKTE
jgi:predicted unusual protein kinase regulating ubiquinone biosynthesis (AarF/ABC1/UbiB family)